MRTIKEILDNYKDYEVFLDDRFGVRLCQFLTIEQMKQLGFELLTNIFVRKQNLCIC